LHTTPSSYIYTPSLHDALPILPCRGRRHPGRAQTPVGIPRRDARAGPSAPRDSTRVMETEQEPPLLGSVAIVGFPNVGKSTLVKDRKSTRLNSSHRTISYAVFC